MSTGYLMTCIDCGGGGRIPTTQDQFSGQYDDVECSTCRGDGTVDDTCHCTGGPHAWNPGGEDTCPDVRMAAEARIALDVSNAAYRDRLAQWNRAVEIGRIDPECPTCLKEFGGPCNPTPGAMAPGHTAKTRCESGKRPHCTCGVCW